MDKKEIACLLDILNICYQKGCIGEECHMLYEKFIKEDNMVMRVCASREAAMIIQQMQ